MLNSQLIEDADDIKCSKHNQEIMLFSMEEEPNIFDRLLCSTCLQTTDTSPRALMWKITKEKIRAKHQQILIEQKSEKDQILQLIRSFKNIVDQIRTQLNKTLEEITTQTSLWISNIEQIEKEGYKINQQCLLEEFGKTIGIIHEQEFNPAKFHNSNNIRQCNYNFRCKLKLSLIKLFTMNLSSSFPQVLTNIMIDSREQELNQNQFDDTSNYLHSQLLIYLQEFRKSFDIIVDTVNQVTKNVLVNQKEMTNSNQFPSLQPIKYQLSDEITQEEYCQAIAFNKDSTLMAAVFNENIKIWEIENGRLKYTDIQLQGHEGNIYCLAFSKKINWFVSAGSDNTIRCWSQTNQNEWASSKTGQKHIASVLFVLLSNNEDTLFSCSKDNSIKVWRVDCGNQLLDYQYSLDKHTNQVNCVSLNKSETSLVSCSDDQSIIIWGKWWWYGKWEFKYVIAKSVDDFGQRLCFMNDNQIAWQQQSKGITHIFELEKGVYKEKPELLITLTQFGDDAGCLFPLIYNPEKKILIQKQNRYVYILRQQKNKKFKIELDPIDCNSTFNYGGFTQNGEYLAIWNQGTKQLRLYRFVYE